MPNEGTPEHPSPERRGIGMTVAVSTEDIWLGRHRNPHHCPIALAVKRQHAPGDVRVYESHMEVHTGGYRRLYATPNDALAFIEAYDGGWQVSPGTFVFPEITGDDDNVVES